MYSRLAPWRQALLKEARGETPPRAWKNLCRKGEAEWPGANPASGPDVDGGRPPQACCDARPVAVSAHLQSGIRGRGEQPTRPAKWNNRRHRMPIGLFWRGAGICTSSARPPRGCWESGAGKWVPRPRPGRGSSGRRETAFRRTRPGPGHGASWDVFGKRERNWRPRPCWRERTGRRSQPTCKAGLADRLTDRGITRLQNGRSVGKEGRPPGPALGPSRLNPAFSVRGGETLAGAEEPCGNRPVQ